MTYFSDPAELLPHGPDMRFIRRVISCDDETIECEVVPGPNDRAFETEGRLPLALMLEYMAQAIAAFVSIRTGAGERKPGFVVAVRRFQVAVPQLESRPLVVRATHRWGEVQVGRFDAAVLRDDETLASASLTVFRPSKEAS